MLALVIFSRACGGSHGCGASSSSSASATRDPRPLPASSANGPGSSARPSASFPAPEVTVRGEPFRGSRQVAIVVESRGKTPAHLAGALTIEREVHGHWAKVAHMGAMTLRTDCESKPPDCVTLVPGAELRPPPWLAVVGAAQCRCDGCARASAGRYRFVVQSCDQAHRIEGVPFDLRRW